MEKSHRESWTHKHLISAGDKYTFLRFFILSGDIVSTADVKTKRARSL